MNQHVQTAVDWIVDPTSVEQEYLEDAFLDAFAEFGEDYDPLKARGAHVLSAALNDAHSLARHELHLYFAESGESIKDYIQ